MLLLKKPNKILKKLSIGELYMNLEEASRYINGLYGKRGVN